MQPKTLNLNSMTEVVLSLPNGELDFLTMLASKMGWGLKTKKDLINKFVDLCEKNSEMSDDEIMAEVEAVRYQK